MRQVMGFFAKIFGTATEKPVDHPIFGKLVLNAGAAGPYWLHEVFEGEEGISISIETRDTAEPTEAQVGFFRRVTGNLDATVSAVLPELSARYAEFHNEPLPTDWRQALKLAGVGVPLDGDGNRAWDVAFECSSLFLYTCYFENGELAHIGVDT